MKDMSCRIGYPYPRVYLPSKRADSDWEWVTYGWGGGWYHACQYVVGTGFFVPTRSACNDQGKVGARKPVPTQQFCWIVIPDFC
jgi:hypothetical protein